MLGAMEEHGIFPIPIGPSAPDVEAGDEIILSIMEHHSNIVPWHFHRERKGAVLKWAPIDEDGNFLLDEFEKLLTPRTKIVALTVSNSEETFLAAIDAGALGAARSARQPRLFDDVARQRMEQE